MMEARRSAEGEEEKWRGEGVGQGCAARIPHKVNRGEKRMNSSRVLCFIQGSRQITFSFVLVVWPEHCAGERKRQKIAWSH